MKLSTRLTLAMVGLVLLTGIATVTAAWISLRSIAVPRAVERLEVHARSMAADIQRTARIARADTLSFAAAAALEGIVRAHRNGGIHPDDGTSEAVWRARMAARFAAELTFKPAYYQFRIVGVEDGGRELVRVDRSGPDGAVRIVPDAALQRKGDTEYFRETIAQPGGTVLVSSLDLNRENGEVETPNVPVLRVATPIMAPDGSVFGIVVINVDMRPAFERIRAFQSASNRIYVVNGRGDFLVHPDPRREFGFEFGRPAGIQDEFPALASALSGSTAQQSLIDGPVERLGVGIAPVQWSNGPWLAVAEIAPYSAIMSASLSVRQATVWRARWRSWWRCSLRSLLSRSLARPLGADDRGRRSVRARRAGAAAARRRRRDRHAGARVRAHGRRDQ